MAEDKKNIVFKIQFSRQKPKLATIGKPRMITQWFYGRIIAWVLMLVVLALVTIELLSDPESIDIAYQQPAKSTINEIPLVEDKSPTGKLATATMHEAPVAQAKTEQIPMPTVAPSPTGVLRSRLALGMWENEPFGDVQLPIKVNNKKATGLFYFTELDANLGPSVYHVWQRNGVTIFKQIKPINGTTKTYTSKLFTMASIGSWTVSVTDSNLQALHTIQFNVVAE